MNYRKMLATIECSRNEDMEIAIKKVLGAAAELFSYSNKLAFNGRINTLHIAEVNNKSIHFMVEIKNNLKTVKVMYVG